MHKHAKIISIFVTIHGIIRIGIKTIFHINRKRSSSKLSVPLKESSTCKRNNRVYNKISSNKRQLKK